MKKKLLFPALKCKLGEWIYYVTYLNFGDVKEWIKPTEEIHTSKKLADWIQRRLDSKHTEGISNYLLNQSERFFNAIVVGVYGGHPSWAPLKVSVPEDVDFEKISDDQELDLESSIGLLKLSGEEKLFAIDGQHRVAGIKKAIRESKELEKEEICAIFVGHENTSSGMERTRRLFTTLNKTAKKVATADIVALDEDDGFAVLTRKLVDDFNIFSQGEKVSFSQNVAIPESDQISITSAIGIYYIAQDLYPRKPYKDALKKSEILKTRPTDEEIENLYRENCNYWLQLSEYVPEYKDTLVNNKYRPDKYRSKEYNHLLFRPVGQRAFASAVELLINRGCTMKQSIERLSKVNLLIHTNDWHYILWNPIQGKMMPGNRVVAETFLLYQLHESGRSLKNDARLREIIQNR
jgi:DNA sulfur modification protein DndB